MSCFACGPDFSPTGLGLLLAWMLAFKMVKPFAYFRRHPRDLALLPFYLAFTYYHSFIKLWALLTFWDTRWTGRKEQ